MTTINIFILRPLQICTQRNRISHGHTSYQSKIQYGMSLLIGQDLIMKMPLFFILSLDQSSKLNRVIYLLCNLVFSVQLTNSRLFVPSSIYFSYFSIGVFCCYISSQSSQNHGQTPNRDDNFPRFSVRGILLLERYGNIASYYLTFCYLLDLQLLRFI